MTVRSFAQNFEDVLLWRALRHVAGGRYVDVGAGHPDYHSVTKLFYDAGWSGINIEPLPALADALTMSRPRDVTIQAAVSSRDVDSVELMIVDSWDELSTIAEDRAEELRAEGRTVSTTTVPSVRLDDVLAAHGLRDVQFLKIDVEGSELDVLLTLDLARTRPWIIVIEVVSGSAPSSARQAIRDHLEGHDYVHSYFDGLNDFYVAGEFADNLLKSFATPVNVTDDFVVVSDTDYVMVEIIGEKLGMTPPVQASEMLQRVEAVVRDRIEFESRFRELEAEVVTAAEAQGNRFEERERELSTMVTGWRLKAEALEQSSFERERMVAWYAAEVANLRRSAQRHEEATARAHAEDLNAREIQNRLDAVLASNSWRITLPLRAIRQPKAYLKALRRR